MWWRELDESLNKGRFFYQQNASKYNSSRSRYTPENSLRPQRESYYETQQRRTIRLGQAASVRKELPTPEHPIPYEFGNPDLPAFENKHEFIQMIGDHRVVIVVGPTGSGKSTQIPQFLLEAGYSTAILQPRLPASNNVGERIEAEIASVIGAAEAKKIVGIHTSEQNTVGDETRITVLTDGLRLAQMTSRKGDVLDEVLVIDEVHEWNFNIELIVALTKKLLQEKPHLRVVIMSATVDAYALSNYFADATGDIPPVLEIEGRTFPIERREEPTSTMMLQVLEHCETAKSILLFVPGEGEVKDTISELHRRLPREVLKTATILPLHSKMTRQEQQRAMKPVDGLKIVVATNVAQTSITIPGLDMVIDSGLERRIELDDEENAGLELHPCSRADLDQRAGRTGRDVAGTYILTRYDEDSEAISYMEREQYAVPEIYRIDLSRGVLRVADYGYDFAELDFFHSLKQKRIRTTKDVLYELGALDEDDKITNLGEYMDRFPLRPMLGRMMYEASRYSESIRKQVAAMAVSVEAGGLQRFGNDIETGWKILLSEDRNSDLLAQLDIFIKLSELRAQGKLTPRLISEYNLDHNNIERAMKQYEKVARRANVSDYYLPPEPPNEQDRETIMMCIYAGMASNTYVRSGSDGKKPTFRQANTTSEPRPLSNRSIVSQPTNVIVGTPYRVQVKRGGELQQFGIIEQVTNVTDIRKLAEVALHLCSEKNPQYQWRGDELQVTTEQVVLAELPTGARLTKTPEWNREIQERYIHKAFETQGPFMKSLLALKRVHEDAARRSRDPLNILTQEMIERWLYEVTTEKATSVGEIDGRLRAYAQEKIAGFVSNDELELVRMYAPDEVTAANGETIRLAYSKGIPTARGTYTRQEAQLFGTTCTIPRGDEVLFTIDRDGRRKSMTLQVIDQLV